jgi:hypothetical protein
MQLRMALRMAGSMGLSKVMRISPGPDFQLAIGRDGEFSAGMIFQSSPIPVGSCWPWMLTCFAAGHCALDDVPGRIPFESEDGHCTFQRLRHQQDFDGKAFKKQCESAVRLRLGDAEANESNRRRCGLTIRYAAADATTWYDWHKKGLVVRGENISGQWANPEMPNH